MRSGSVNAREGSTGRIGLAKASTARKALVHLTPACPFEGHAAGCRPSSSGLQSHRKVSVPLTHGKTLGRRADAGPLLHVLATHRTGPKKTTARVPELRMRLREGPVQLATRTGLVSSILHRILSAARLNQSSQADRMVREKLVRRYEHGPPVA